MEVLDDLLTKERELPIVPMDEHWSYANCLPNWIH